MPTSTLQTQLRHAYQLLHFLENPRLEAELLLAHVLQKARSTLYAYPEQELTAAEIKQFQALLQQRLNGEPLAYLLGEKEFWSLSLAVNNTTLIPRPETELLVEQTLKLLPTTLQNVADLGTGSGAIALALAKERPSWRIVATDYFPALEIAQQNAKRLGLLQVEFRSGNWCDALPADVKFHAIISNPPYIAEGDLHLPNLAHEPITALVSGKAGLDALHLIIQQAHAHLAHPGWLLLEHGFDQGVAVRGMLLENRYSEVVTYQDLAGLERVTVGVLGR